MDLQTQPTGSPAECVTGHLLTGTSHSETRARALTWDSPHALRGRRRPEQEHPTLKAEAPGRWAPGQPPESPSSCSADSAAPHAASAGVPQCSPRDGLACGPPSPGEETGRRESREELDCPQDGRLGMHLIGQSQHHPEQGHQRRVSPLWGWEVSPQEGQDWRGDPFLTPTFSGSGLSSNNERPSPGNGARAGTAAH